MPSCVQILSCRGYRAGGDYKRCLAALFELHTETMNAWTMLAGGVVSIAMLAWVIAATQPSITALIPFLALTAAVLVHMPFSVGFHLFRGINAEVYNLWRRLDQIFIFLVSVLLAFGLSWHVYSTWWGIAVNTGAALGVAVFAIRDLWGLQPHFQRNRGLVVVFVGCIVLCYWFPMVSGEISACQVSNSCGLLLVFLQTLRLSCSMLVIASSTCLQTVLAGLLVVGFNASCKYGMGLCCQWQPAGAWDAAPNIVQALSYQSQRGSASLLIANF